MRRLHDVYTKTSSCFGTVNDVVDDDFCISITETRIVVVFHTDDFIRTQGPDFLGCHFHPVDAHLYFAVARYLDGIVYRVYLDAGKHQLLEQVYAVGRGLLLTGRRIDDFPVHFAPLG